MYWTILIFIAFFICWKIWTSLFGIIDNSLVRWTGKLSSNIWSSMITGVFNAGNKITHNLGWGISKGAKNLSDHIKDETKAFKDEQQSKNIEDVEDKTEDVKDKIVTAKETAQQNQNVVHSKIHDMNTAEQKEDAEERQLISKIIDKDQGGTISIVNTLEKIGEILKAYEGKNKESLEKNFLNVSKSVLWNKEFVPIQFNEKDIEDEQLLAILKTYNKLGSEENSNTEKENITIENTIKEADVKIEDKKDLSGWDISQHIEKKVENENIESVNKVEQKIEKINENKVEERTENKFEKKTEQKIEQQIENNNENKVEQKTENKVEQRIWDENHTQQNIDKVNENKVEQTVEQNIEKKVEENIENKVEHKDIKQEIKIPEKIKNIKQDVVPTKVQEKIVIKETIPAGLTEYLKNKELTQTETKQNSVNIQILNKVLPGKKEVPLNTKLLAQLAQQYKNLNQKQDPSSVLFRQTRNALKNLNLLQDNIKGNKKDMNVKLDELSKYMSLDSKNTRSALKSLLNN